MTQARKKTKVKPKKLIGWKYRSEMIAVLAPEFNVKRGAFLSQSNRDRLKDAGLTPTKFTQIKDKGPLTIEDLVSLCRLLNCQPGDLIYIPSPNYRATYGEE